MSNSAATSGPVAIPSNLPSRPGYGKRGRPISLETNFFKVEIPSDLTLFHYDVTIEPTVPKAIKRKVMQAAVENNKAAFSGQFPVFDGEKGLYCHKKLPYDKASLYNNKVLLRARKPISHTLKANITSIKTE